MQDRYGVLWHLIFDGTRQTKQRVTPKLIFVRYNSGKKEEAINFYTSIFHDTKVGDKLRYIIGEKPDKEGTIKHASFTLKDRESAAMDFLHVYLLI